MVAPPKPLLPRTAPLPRCKGVVLGDHRCWGQPTPPRPPSLAPSHSPMRPHSPPPPGIFYPACCSPSPEFNKPPVGFPTIKPQTLFYKPQPPDGNRCCRILRVWFLPGTNEGQAQGLGGPWCCRRMVLEVGTVVRAGGSFPNRLAEKKRTPGAPREVGGGSAEGLGCARFLDRVF